MSKELFGQYFFESIKGRTMLCHISDILSYDVRHSILWACLPLATARRQIWNPILEFAIMALQTVIGWHQRRYVAISCQNISVFWHWMISCHNKSFLIRETNSCHMKSIPVRSNHFSPIELWQQVQNCQKDDLRNKDNIKNENNIKNEDDLKNEEVLKNKDNLKN